VWQIAAPDPCGKPLDLIAFFTMGTGTRRRRNSIVLEVTQTSTRRILACLVTFALAAGTVQLRAHVVLVQQVVQVSVQPQGSRSSFELHVPATLLVDASLPRSADRPDRRVSDQEPTTCRRRRQSREIWMSNKTTRHWPRRR